MNRTLFFLIFTLVVFAPSCSNSIASRTTSRREVSSEAVNINTAGKLELQRIPHIGEKLAEDIIAHREKFGPFRRTENLLLLHGISDRRFRDIRDLVRVD